MGKAKNVTNTEVGKCCMDAENASETAVAIKEAIDKCQIDQIDNPMLWAKKLLIASRDLTEAGLALINQHDLQKMR